MIDNAVSKIYNDKATESKNKDAVDYQKTSTEEHKIGLADESTKTENTLESTGSFAALPNNGQDITSN